MICTIVNTSVCTNQRAGFRWNFHFKLKNLCAPTSGYPLSGSIRLKNSFWAFNLIDFFWLGLPGPIYSTWANPWMVHVPGGLVRPLNGSGTLGSPNGPGHCILAWPVPVFQSLSHSGRGFTFHMLVEHPLLSTVLVLLFVVSVTAVKWDRQGNFFTSSCFTISQCFTLLLLLHLLHNVANIPKGELSKRSDWTTFFKGAVPGCPNRVTLWWIHFPWCLGYPIRCSISQISYLAF